MTNLDYLTVPIDPPQPLTVLAKLLEKAEYDEERDLYTIRITGDLYRLWTNDSPSAA